MMTLSRPAAVARGAMALLGPLLSPVAATASPPDSALTNALPRATVQHQATNFDTALRCMDDMVARSGIPAGFVLIPQPLQDDTRKFGATRDMIISAATKLSERSHFFRIAFDAPRNSSRFFVVQGSITAYDQMVYDKDSGVGLSFGTFMGGNLTKRKALSNFTLSLFFMDERNVLIPGTFHSESITLKTSADSAYIGGQIGSVGGSLDFSSSLVEGQQGATQALIDVAMIEAVGNLLHLPYSRCLAASATDPADMVAGRASFDHLRPAAQHQAIIDGLAKRGLIGAGASPDDERAAIAAFEAEQGLPPLGAPSFQLYYALRQADAASEAASVDKPRPGRRGVAVRVTSEGGGIDYDPARGYAIAHAENKLTFAVNVAEPAYIACYYIDANNNVARVFPNALRTAYQLAPGEVLRIPSDEDSFQIRAEESAKNKTEWFTCMAAREPFLDKIASAIPNVPKQKLPLASANDLVKTAKNLDPDLSIDTLSYLVLD